MVVCFCNVEILYIFLGLSMTPLVGLSTTPLVGLIISYFIQLLASMPGKAATAKAYDSMHCPGTTDRRVLCLCEPLVSCNGNCNMWLNLPGA